MYKTVSCIDNTTTFWNQILFQDGSKSLSNSYPKLAKTDVGNSSFLQYIRADSNAFETFPA